MKEEKSSQSLNGHHADCALIPSNGLFGIETFFFPTPPLSFFLSLSISPSPSLPPSHLSLFIQSQVSYFSFLYLSVLSFSLNFFSICFSLLAIQSSTYNDQQIETISFQVVPITNVFINEAQIEPFNAHRNDIITIHFTNFNSVFIKKLLKPTDVIPLNQLDKN